MRLDLLAVAAFVVVALTVPTAAVTTGGGGEDEVADAVSISPHDGPNGEYASIDDGELRVDFDGLNDEANTLAHDVFQIESTADDPIRVWVETDDDNVTAYEGDDPDAEIDGRDDARELTSGETLDVGFEIDTHGTNPDNGTVTIGVLVPDDDNGTADVVVTDAEALQDETVVGETVGVEATLENRGDAGGTRTVNLTVDGSVVDSDSVFVPADGTETIRFDHSFSQPGDYTLAVDGVDAGTVTVHPAGQAVVTVTGATVADERIPAGGRTTVSATVENVGDRTGTGAVDLTVDGTVVATRNVTLAPGERRQVSFSRQFDDPGTYRLRVGGVDAGRVTVVDPDDGRSGSGDDGVGVPDDGAGGEQPPDDGGVQVDVVFDGGVGGQGDVEVIERDALPEGEPSANTTALTDPVRVLGMPDDDLTANGSRFVTRPGEPVELTGARSRISTADGIARQSRIAAVVDITPPSELEDQPATVRFRVDRDEFDATDPTEARIGRHTDDGWQLLPTRVVEETDDTVVLEARTFGFSVFTVFAESKVQYEWTLPNGMTVSGDEITTSFDDPGRYDVTLTVNDGFGRADESQHRVLVNDPPSATIEGVENATAGEETTLRANVTNEIGNATVTWTLPDGSTATGREVTGEFAAGETVRATVEDEFGATGRTEATIGASDGGDASEGPLAGLASLPIPFPAWVGAALVGLAVLLSALAARSEFVWRAGTGVSDLVGTAGRLLASDSPRVTGFENPRWNPEQDCIEIDELSVEAPSGLLDTIEITITDESSDVVVGKTIDVGARATYSAAPERIPVYGDVGVSPGRGYRIRVQAVDERQRVGTRERTQEALSTSVAEF